MKQVPRRLRTGVAATLFATQLMACTSWKVVDPSPLAFVAQPPQRVRVTLADSTRIVWNNTVMVDRRIGPAPDAAPGVQLTDVRRLEERRFSWVKTTLLVGLMVGAAVAAKGFGDAMSWGGGYGDGVNFPGPWSALRP